VRGQFGGVVGPHGSVQAKPQSREFAGSIHHDAGAGIAGAHKAEITKQLL